MTKNKEINKVTQKNYKEQNMLKTKSEYGKIRKKEKMEEKQNGKQKNKNGGKL